MNTLLKNKTILITGGTGSLGKTLTRHILTGKCGMPRKIVIFSRDEAKQHNMRIEYQNRQNRTDEVVYEDYNNILNFKIGNIADFTSVVSALQGVDIVFNAAAMKQVPSCENHPFEAVKTNIIGAENIVRAIEGFHLPIEAVIGISTDKAAKPVNVMGMTKGIQEHIFAAANIVCHKTRFVIARYGNVLASRGSVIPYFHEQIRNGGPVTITDPGMTRFLLSLDEAVEVILSTLAYAKAGEIVIPRIPAAKVTDIAKALIGARPIETKVIGVRPGEKIHEILISEEESMRVRILEESPGKYYAIGPMLKELANGLKYGSLGGEYSSSSDLMDFEATKALLKRRHLTLEQLSIDTTEQELLR